MKANKTFYRTKTFMYIPRVILGAVLFSIISTISLYDNYVSSSLVKQDGITISNKLAYLYIGEDGWSQEAFRSAYDRAFMISIVLLIVYIAVLVLEIIITKKSE